MSNRALSWLFALVAVAIVTLAVLTVAREDPPVQESTFTEVSQELGVYAKRGVPRDERMAELILRMAEAITGESGNLTPATIEHRLGQSEMLMDRWGEQHEQQRKD